MRRFLLAALVTGLGLSSAQAAPVLMTFEGVGNLNPIGNFYNGGAGGNYGITWSATALGLVDSDAGGSGNIGGEPSPSTVAFSLNSTTMFMDSAIALTGDVSGFYSAPQGVQGPLTVEIWSGLGGTGSLLGSQILPLTPLNGAPDPNGQFSPLVPFSVSFAGSGQSVVFRGSPNQYVVDDVTVTQNAPEPMSMAIFGGLAVAGIAGYRRRSQAKA
jgi:hypothetical protein